jgi:tetratricopeptide (TPR) repeat protein
VKLGSLAQVGQGKWELVDASSAPARPDLIFRTSDTGSPRQPQADLVLLNGKDGGLLWSREFSFPPGGEADLRQQLSLTAGRVLGCALESRAAGGLRRDLLKLFLNACAVLAETSSEDPTKSFGLLRSVVTAEPRFEPAWARLIYAEAQAVDWADSGEADTVLAEATRNLRDDIGKVEKLAPDLPQLTLAKIKFLPPMAYRQRLDLLAKAAEEAPNTPEIFAEQQVELQRVGRMSDAVDSARRASELDPLSPSLTTQAIMALAYAGRLDEARQELSRAERLWAGTGALRDALWAFNLRYGDPALARNMR